MTPPVKTCFKCGQEKPITEFYKHPKMGDGYFDKCKECTKDDNNKNRDKKLSYYKEYDRSRAMLPKRVEARKAYAHTENGKRSRMETTKKYRRENPEKWLAHAAVSYAIKTGKIIKKPCEICGASFVHAHHPDYSKPLEVIWLCPAHHRMIHAQQAA